MTHPVTVDQLRNLTDRAARGPITPDEQQRLREGIDALHAERADAWQKFATVAAQRDRLRIRMNALADRWEHALGVDKLYARALRAEISIEPFGTDDTPSPAPATTQPTPAHTHIWDGGDLPDWLTGHHWHDDQLVIRTPDGDTRPHAGWWLIAWSDGSVTAASPTSGERVYGVDGITDRLERAETELARYTEAESADAAAGSYAGRVEELEAELARLRPQLARAQRIAMDVLDDGPLERIRALPREPQIVHHIRIHGMPDQDAYNRGWSSAISAVHAALDTPPAATQATEPAASPLRDLIAAALYERERPPRDPHWPDAYAMDREVFEPMADAVLTAITQHLDIGDAQAWCKYCRRAWDSPAHRCESDAEQRVQKIAELRDQWLAAWPPVGQPVSRWVDARLVELTAVLNEEQPGPG